MGESRADQNRAAIAESLEGGVDVESGHGDEKSAVPARTVEDWKTAARSERPTSMEDFESEVQAKIGIPFDQISEGTQDDMLGGPSILAFENWKVVGVGKPAVDEETGEEIYSQFLRIDTTQ